MSEKINSKVSKDKIRILSVIFAVINIRDTFIQTFNRGCNENFFALDQGCDNSNFFSIHISFVLNIA